MTTMDPQQAAVLDGVRQLGERLPFNRHLGVEVVEVVPGRARTRLPENDALAAGTEVLTASLHFVFIAVA